MKVWSLGDAVVDLIPLQNMQYEACAGGAPVNVAAGVAKLGQQSGFIGRVGEDAFGHFMQKTLFDLGVDTRAMEFDEFHRTSTVLVSLQENGERDFTFLVAESADQFLTEKSLPAFEKDILHFCSLALVNPICRSTLDCAIKNIKESGSLLSFDINLRPQMWRDHEEMREVIDNYAHKADILKLSEDELTWMTQEVTLNNALKKLEDYPARLKVITQGSKGCLVLTPNTQVAFSAFIVECIDTTGAGDAFMSGLLAALAEYGFAEDEPYLSKIVTQAAACGALATTKKGAIAAAPSRKKLHDFVQQQPPLHVREIF
ncbi:aminoimidazole riboside kinase [Proteus sp. DFP240708]|uniref:Aminoimidazole riboside kinase n=2 Tax=Proteus TaxID=583 RepID=A0A6I7D735_9GAMM|nr:MULTISPECIES: aminoimidazole riboside kinase [Proteus]MBG2711734.1 aminoimidazole riboside kinase [Proteus mirabilis]MCF1957604.1 aminoimidazole riboside kinase [Escherichia coli]MBG2768581.1 aminoimidazole riboside kinase [Proteus mirabilis]MBG2803040.1 aminoimidazole riboside kinase [Proteus mirabilis]MBG3020885.1 aminoimidazole riboside kinase [Proteus mirabilis]